MPSYPLKNTEARRSRIWRCVLCGATVGESVAALHHEQCPAEQRIREIIREELAQQREGDGT